MIRSQSSVEIHSVEEEASTVAAVDAGLHEEEQLPDWMSQLFEKLELEVNEDNICSTAKEAQVDTHPFVEGGISSEIHRSSKGKDSLVTKVDIGGLHEESELSDWMSQMLEKLELEANNAEIRSTGKVAQRGRHPLVEGGISSEIHRSLEEKNSAMAKVDVGGLYDEDKFLDWMLDMMKIGGYEDDEMCSLFKVEQGEKYPIHYKVPDEFYDLIDKEAKDFCKRKKKVSYKKTIENGVKWMSEECFLAFTKSAENFHFEGIEYKFGGLQSQCFSVETYDKIFHHYNFTIEAKHESSDVWTSELYFAEVKQLSGLKYYFCCLLESNDQGHCYGCMNQDVYDLKHPSRGGYEEGDAGICFPFMDDPEYDSDSNDDCDLGY